MTHEASQNAGEGGQGSPPRADDVVAKLLPPWDAKLIGWACFAYGIPGMLLSIALISGLARNANSSWRPVVLFGLTELRTELWLGVTGVIVALAVMLGGYGLAKGRKFGWWFAVVIILESIPDLLVNLMATPRVAPIWLALHLLLLGWLTWRIPLYRPFGERKIGARHTQ